VVSGQLQPIRVLQKTWGHTPFCQHALAENTPAACQQQCSIRAPCFHHAIFKLNMHGDTRVYIEWIVNISQRSNIPCWYQGRVGIQGLELFLARNSSKFPNMRASSWLFANNLPKKTIPPKRWLFELFQVGPTIARDVIELQWLGKDALKAK